MIPDRLSIQFKIMPDGGLCARRLYPDGPLQQFYGEWLTWGQMNGVAAAILCHASDTVLWDEARPDEIREYPERRQRPERSREGYAYLVREHGGAYKIGRAANLAHRVWSQISPKLPYPLSLVAAHQSDDAIELEAAFHEHFSGKRLAGEWFSLDEEDVQFFIRTTRARDIP